MEKNLDKKNINPIFIISTARSGTTSLSNQLCQHSEIYGFLSKEHWGIKELRFLDSWRYYFTNLEKDENLFFFIENFSISDEFVLSGLKKETLYKNRPNDMIDVMNLILDNILDKNKVKFLLVNNPRQAFYLKELISYFPDAYYIVIRRSILPTIKSTIKKIEKKKSILLYCKHIIGYRSAFDVLDKEKRRIKHLIEIDFEEFIGEQEYIFKKILNFLNLEWEEDVLRNPYKINQSFNNAKSRKTYFNKGDVIIIKILNSIFKIFSISYILRPLGIWWDKKNARKSVLPPLKYRLNSNSKYLEGEKFNK